MRTDVAGEEACAALGSAEMADSTPTKAEAVGLDPLGEMCDGNAPVFDSSAPRATSDLTQEEEWVAAEPQVAIAGPLIVRHC